jgi:hypothetical protein
VGQEFGAEAIIRGAAMMRESGKKMLGTELRPILANE